jgi:hypothetical protein
MGALNTNEKKQNERKKTAMEIGFKKINKDDLILGPTATAANLTEASTENP